MNLLTLMAANMVFIGTVQARSNGSHVSCCYKISKTNLIYPINQNHLHTSHMQMVFILSFSSHKKMKIISGRELDLLWSPSTLNQIMKIRTQTKLVEYNKPIYDIRSYNLIASRELDLTQNLSKFRNYLPLLGLWLVPLMI